MMNNSTLRSMSIARKLSILIASALLGIVLLTALFLWSERALILAERESSVRQAVETAHGLLVDYEKQASGGLLSRPLKSER